MLIFAAICECRTKLFQSSILSALSVQEGGRKKALCFSSNNLSPTSCSLCSHLPLKPKANKDSCRDRKPFGCNCWEVFAFMIFGFTQKGSRAGLRFTGVGLWWMSSHWALTGRFWQLWEFQTPSARVSWPQWVKMSQGGREGAGVWRHSWATPWRQPCLQAPLFWPRALVYIILPWSLLFCMDQL